MDSRNVQVLGKVSLACKKLFDCTTEEPFTVGVIADRRLRSSLHSDLKALETVNDRIAVRVTSLTPEGVAGVHFGAYVILSRDPSVMETPIVRGVFGHAPCVFIEVT